MTLSADEVRPAARLIESTRRIVSASVSELLTISAKFESLICVLIGSVTSEVKPLLNSATTVARADTNVARGEPTVHLTCRGHRQCRERIQIGNRPAARLSRRARQREIRRQVRD